MTYCDVMYHNGEWLVTERRDFLEDVPRGIWSTKRHAVEHVERMFNDREINEFVVFNKEGKEEQSRYRLVRN